MVLQWWLRWQAWRRLRRCRYAQPSMAAVAQAKLEADRRRMRIYEQLAPAVASLPPQELAARIGRALSYRGEGTA